MKYSQAFIHTQKLNNEKQSYDLVEKSGLVYKYSAGSYGYMPLGQRVLENITNICNQEMKSAGALKVSAPLVQSADLWIKSERWNIYGDEMLKMKNREKQQFCMAPTHEEAFTDMVNSMVQTSKQFPFTLYQIGTKYRDEIRPRHGLLRTREFIMLDAYSFDVDEKGLARSYQSMSDTFKKIFSSMNIKVITSEANTGEVGGSFSEEFLAPATFGEDEISTISGNIKGIEVGHIFKLGTKYSNKFNLKIVSGNNNTPVIMGCYGIGISRLIPAIIDQHNDKNGIIWPTSISPFPVEIIPLGPSESKTHTIAEHLEKELQSKGIEALVDDREVSTGIKFKDSDLIGIPYKIIIGKNSIDSNVIEIEERKTKTKQFLSSENILKASSNFESIFK